MWFNHYEAELVMKERVKDALRKAEQERLIRAAKGPRKVRGWRLPVALVFSSLLSLVIRPQSRWTAARRPAAREMRSGG